MINNNFDARLYEFKLNCEINKLKKLVSTKDKELEEIKIKRIFLLGKIEGAREIIDSFKNNKD